ncbi:ABC transporter permease [Streptomyces sp. Ncost-T10-10d]|uniref:ABC transporter permease n=1 Tax=Streptomyces sp. Ncost-T10-10d TaxID=1839774 RepID=UPI00081E9247|nr:ABC transporter permease [Streptomyces sp. Ncost-T10-10d]SCF67806.1 putative ABC transport system permease protein [Streptomyces sp. Ncost-T10-10d]
MRRGIAAGVAVALVCAAMLTGAFGVLLESALRAHGSADRYERAVAVVAVSQRVEVVKDDQTDVRPLVERARVPVSVADRARAVPGVTEVVADVSLPVVTADGAVRTGRGWDATVLTAVELRAGRAPQAEHEVAVDSGGGRAVGDTVRLQVGGRAPEPYRVSGLVAGGSGAGHDVWFGQHTAQVLSGRPEHADALVVLGTEKTSVQSLRAAAPGLVVATGADRGDVENPEVAAARLDLIGVCASIGGVALLVVLLILTGLLDTSVRDRTRELAVLRAIGATPRQVRKVIVRETLKVAVPASLLGGLLSLGLGTLLHRFMAEQGVLPPGLGLALGPFPVVGALALTVLTGVGSAWLAARRVSRIRPAQAVSETSAEPTRLPRWRVITGLVLLVVGLASAGTAFAFGGQVATAAMGGLVLSLIWAAALLGPSIARGGIVVLSPVMRLLFPVPGRLATDTATAAAVRLASVITPIALALSFGASQLFVQTTAVNATRTQAAAGLHADQVLDSNGPGVPRAMYRAVERTAGPGTVTAVKRTTVVMSVAAQLQSLPTQGVKGALSNLDPDVKAGLLKGLHGKNTVALSSNVASAAKVGSTVSLWLGDGTVIRPKVVAVYDRGQGFGDVLLPHDVVAAHVTDAGHDDYLLVKGAADLRPVLDRFPGTRATSAGQYSAALTEKARQQALPGLLAVAAISLFTLIGVVTTLAVSTASRRRELALLRLIGATRGQVLAMLRLETCLVLGTGAAVGSLVAAVTLLTFGGAVTGLSALSVSPSVCAAVLGTVFLSGMAAVMLPARRLLRRRKSPRIT